MSFSSTRCACPQELTEQCVRALFKNRTDQNVITPLEVPGDTEEYIIYDTERGRKNENLISLGLQSTKKNAEEK
jgi:hypothetical protein